MASLFPEDHAKLPPCTSLLLQGPYPPSAPFHLALSHTNQLPSGSGSDALFISPSRDAILAAFRSYNDTWLSTNSAHGLSERVRMLYPPTPAHFTFLLKSLEAPTAPPEGRKLHEKTTLDGPPSLIIMHELSAYFLPDLEADPGAHQWTLSSYLSLITQTMSIAAFLSPSPNEPIPIVLFDSQLNHLRLPLLKFPATRHRREGEVSLSIDLNPSRELGDPPRPTEPVLRLAREFFHVVGTFERVPVGDEYHGSLNLVREADSEGGPFQSWEWTEKRDATGTRFFWD